VRATACSTTLVFSPTDDATVRADQPDTNFGTSTTLVADASPLRNFLLKFSISGVGSCQVTSAKLRLFQVDSSDRGGDFHITTGAWSDSTVKWNYNFPALGPVVASLGRVSSGQWYEVDLTPVVQWDGVVSLGVTSPSSDGAYYSSKEGANPPQLVLTLGPPPSSNSHAPIFIDGNSGFTYVNGVKSGSGTASDPYVISNWDIDLCQPGAGCGGSGIFVENTDANFVIRNVRVRSSGSINAFSYYDADVYLSNVANGRVENSTLSDGRSGITVEASKYVTLSGNNLSVQPIYISSGGGGETQVAGPCISIHSSTSIAVSGNTLSPCVNGMESFGTTGMVVSGNKFVQDGVYGLFLEGYGADSTVEALIENNQFGPGTDRGIEINDGANVTQTTISGNIFSGQGIDLHPPTIADCCPSNTMVYGLAQLSSNTITTDNLVNGKPIYYFEGCSGTSVNGIPVGQLIVVNCTNFQASNLQISSVIEGIVLSNVHGATIINDTLSNISRFGVLAFNSDHVTVTGNNITAGNGIQFYISSNMIVYHNNFLGGGDFAGGAYQGMDYKGSYDSWDYGYPSGGNFWWNYNATDNCGGPQQDVCTGPDGIGDTPFGLDRYPLMKPYPVQINPPVSFDFSLSTPSPSSLTVAQGGTSPSSWITAALVNAPSYGYITFTTSSLTNGVTAAFTRNPCPFLGNVQGTPLCIVSVSFSATTTATVGTTTVTITADSEGVSHSTSISLTVTAQNPASPPGVTVSPPTPNPASTGSVVNVAFSVSSSSTVTGITVNWGDGTAADNLAGTARSDSHVYTSTGTVKSKTFTITVTATNSAGPGSGTTTEVVNDLLPVVTISSVAPTSPCVGQSVTVSFASTDPDGTVASNVVSWGDGTAVDNLPGTATSDTHTYTVGGTFAFSVTATDNSGSTGQGTGSITTVLAGCVPTVTVNNPTPNPASTGTSITVMFTVSSQTPVTGIILNWGDGTARDTLAGTATSDTHIYTSTGSLKTQIFTITVTATNDAGPGSGTSSETINDQPPTVTISSVSPNPALTGSTVNVSFSSTDPDGSVSAFTVAWGDGTTPPNLPGTATSATHIYGSTGNAKSQVFIITVTATDNSGSTAQVTGSVTVNIPTVAPYALVVTAEGKVYRFYQNGTLTLVGQPVTTPLRQVAWKPDGSYALIVGDFATLLKYDGASLTTVPTGISTGFNFWSVSWKQDGSYALIGGSVGLLLKYDGVSVTQISNPGGTTILSQSWHPSGSYVVLSGKSGGLRTYDGSTIKSFATGTTNDLNTVAWNPNGQYALIGGLNGVVLKFDGTMVTSISTNGLTGTNAIKSIAFNPSGSLALLVGDNGMVLTYDGSVLTLLPNITGSWLYAVSWSTSGTAYILGGSGTVLTYANGTEAKLTTSPVTTSQFRGIAWKPQ